MMPAPPSARSLSCCVVSRTSPETTAVRSGSLELAISRSSEILTLALSVVSTRYKARQKCHVSLDDVTIAPAPWPTSQVQPRLPANRSVTPIRGRQQSTKQPQASWGYRIDDL